jgi:hypothetical protein
MKILALEHENTSAKKEEFQLHHKKEAHQVWNLQQQGFIREIYFRADYPSAVLILECEDEQEAEKVLSTLPLVQAGLISFELIPLVPYPGFSRLFEYETDK